MALILVKPPVPTIAGGIRKEGIDPNRTDVTPGQPPPWIIPHCFKCRAPVETFTVDYISSPFYLPIAFTCHGKTGGLKVPYIDVLKAEKEGGALWVFTETKVSGHGFRRTYKR